MPAASKHVQPSKPASAAEKNHRPANPQPAPISASEPAPLQASLQRSPGGLRPADLPALQRLAGNRAAARLVNVQRASAAGPASEPGRGSFRVDAKIESALQATQGQGSPLPAEVRGFMEPRFGADFSSVHLHTDASAAVLNRALSAQAFTIGQDIYMGAGHSHPGSPSGQRLLAHELAHVVQQSGRAIHRKPALAISSHKTYLPDPADAKKVKTGLFGKKTSDQTLERYARFDVKNDQAAANAPGYHPINTPGSVTGHYAAEEYYKEANPLVETRVIKEAASLRWEGGAREVKPGDLFKVQEAVGAELLWGKHQVNSLPAQEGALEKSAAADMTNALKEQNPDFQPAVTNDEDTRLFKRRSDDRTQTVGVEGVLERIFTAGQALQVAFNASGVDAEGKETLLLAKYTKPGASTAVTGFIEKARVRSMEASAQKLKTKNTAEHKTSEALTSNLIAFKKGSLMMYDMSKQAASGAPQEIGLRASPYTFHPGDVLNTTGQSRVETIGSGAPYFTEVTLLTAGAIGMLKVNEARKLNDMEDVKLNQSMAGITTSDLKMARVKDKAGLYKIVDENRKTTLRMGAKDTTVPEDAVIQVAFDWRGVDSRFSFEWVYAQYKDTDGVQHKGYIRESKLTNEETEGKVGALGSVQGNLITPGTSFVAVRNSELVTDAARGSSPTKIPVKVGDRIMPDAASISTSSKYYGLVNKNSTDPTLKGSIAHDDVIIASGDLINNAPTFVKSIIVDKAHQREQVLSPRDPAKNVGVSDTTAGDALESGDKLDVAYNTAGVDNNKNTGWLLSKNTRNGDHIGYIRAKKVREDSADAAQSSAMLAYVVNKTHLRDEKMNTQEAKEPGDEVQVRFNEHPLQADFGPNYTKWVKVEMDNATTKRYIREFKVTTIKKTTSFKPHVESGPGVREAFQELIGGAIGTPADQLGSNHSDRGLESDSGPITVRTDYTIGHSGDAAAGSLDMVMGLINLVRVSHEGSQTDNGWKKAGAVYEGVGSAAKSFAGASKMVAASDKLYNDAALESTSMLKTVADWSDGIAGAIESVKQLAVMLYRAVKQGRSRSTNRAMEAWEAITRVLEAGYSGVKAAKSLVEAITGAAGPLVTAVPAIGIALNVAKGILGFVKWAHAKSAEMRAIKEQKGEGGAKNTTGEYLEITQRVKFGENRLVQAVIRAVSGSCPVLPGGFIDEPVGSERKDMLFWEEARGVRSASTLFRKSDYFRINPKILFAIRNQEKLDRVKPDGTLVYRSKEYYSADFYLEMDVSGATKNFVCIKFGSSVVKINPSAEDAIRQYEFVSKAEEVSKKKKTLGGEDIRTALVNMVGEALQLAGPAAMSGAIVKGVWAAIGAGFSFARFLNKQIDNNLGRKRHDALRYQGEIQGVDKSSVQKMREYGAHANFILEMIAKLPPPDAILKAKTRLSDQRAFEAEKKKILEEYLRVQRYLQMTGVNLGLFYAAAGRPARQAKLIVEALSER